MMENKVPELRIPVTVAGDSENLLGIPCRP